MIHLVWPIPSAPLLGALILGLFGHRIKGKSHFIAVPALGISFIFSFLAALRVLNGETLVVDLYQWIPSADFLATIGFQVDALSAVMLLVVTFVSFLIHVYSIGYMHGDEGYWRFFCYLNLFVFSMVMLVLADNLLLLYVFWEAVGLCSYLLIGFWYKKQSAVLAGKKAFVVNRVGDFGFGLGIMLIFTTTGALGYSQVFANAEHLPQAVLTVITLLLFVGATGKSAQIPLFVWLPDAMEGPTPVSALIHAATMVTAGVYMVARMSPLFHLSAFSSEVVAIVGCLTALMAASIATVQNDIKRVLAYSTISQIGYMFIGVGLGAYSAGVFHLATHAFFKALLFLGAGSVMHAMADELDIRKMGALRKKLPATFITFFIAGLAISGVPPFAGFFSKDEILAHAFHNGHYWIYGIGLLTAALTAFYIFRVIFMVFFGKSRWDDGVKPHESPPVMTWPLGILAFFSAVAGFAGLPLANGTPIGRFLAPAVSEAHAAGGLNLEMVLLMLVSVAAAVAGIYLAYAMYVSRRIDPVALKNRFERVYQLMLNKYYVDELYFAVFVHPLVKGSRWVWQRFDLAVIDGMVNGAAKVVQRLAAGLRRLQTGETAVYALAIFIGAILILSYYVIGL
ncbi:NADH-quinone oxidoreductase subunit L [candidate division KSB1 bacterium]